MSSIKRVGDLDIEQDLDFQQRSWRVQRAGWIAMALVTLLALLGLFGSGPLGNATAGEEGAPLRLEYGRFVRLGAPSHLRVHIGPGTTPNGEAHLWLSRVYLEEIEIQRITPEPDRVEAGSDRLTYIFLVPEAQEPTAVTFYFEPDQIGSLGGQVGLADASSLSFGQFVYP